MTNKKLEYKYGYVYTDGGERGSGDVRSAGVGIHGYYYNELPSRIAKVPVLMTPAGYMPKPTGKEIANKMHNPVWSNWGYETCLREEDGKIKTTKGDDCDVMVLDAWYAMPGSNNRGELSAIISILDPNNENRPIECEYITIRSDSKITVDAINGGMVKWKNNGWRNSAGVEPKNIDLWMMMDKIIESIDMSKVHVEWIKAHNGDFGNEAADRNATIGVMSGINNYHESKWMLTPVGTTDYWECDKIIPPILRNKWAYQLTNSQRATIVNDDVTYTEYFVGNHTKDAGDPILLGAELSDATFQLVYNKEPVPIIDDICKFHIDNFYTHSCNMYKSELINMVNITNACAPKVVWFLKNAWLPGTVLKSSRTDVVTPSDHLISMLCNPPKLSYRSLDIRRNLRSATLSALKKMGHSVVFDFSDCSVTNNVAITEITDKLYSYETKKDNTVKCKLLGALEQTTKTLTLEVNNPCSAKPVKLIISVNIDMPIRNTMSAIADDNPKVYIVCVRSGERTFTYGTLIITDKAISFTSGYYQAMRVLDDGEFDAR